MEFQQLALIPVFNHPDRIGEVVSALRAHSLDVLLVDDGSEADTATILDRLAESSNVYLLRLTRNHGKGGAVSAGLEWASKNGYTHALQVDADGQHDINDAPNLLAIAKNNPLSLVSGRPVYDASVPRSRLIGRYLTHVWVWFETLTFSIPDSMCGFRVYPVLPTLRVIDEEGVGQRMDFDTEIMVRMYWRGHDPIFLPTRVHYPESGISHFKLVADNWRITRMHTRLVFGMLLRLPYLLTGRRTKPISWSRMTERGGLLGMRMIAWIAGVLGRRSAELLLWPTTAYFLLFNREARQASRKYLARIHRKVSPDLRDSTRPRLVNSYRHFLAFSREVLTKIQAWKTESLMPEVLISGENVLEEYRATGRGALLITSHLGNVEISRALAASHPDLKINALVYTRNARKFTSLMEELAPGYRERMVLVEEIGSDTIIYLRTLIDKGEIVVIVGDRTPPSENGRVVEAKFLDAIAPFAVGPYLLGHLLECPVSLLFCVREGKRYRLMLETLAERIYLPRGDRMAELRRLAQIYASRLEHYALHFPLQWFNFFDFWQETGPSAGIVDGVNHGG